MFGFQFFFLLENKENIKNTKFKEHEGFLGNTKIVLFVFSKTVLKNNFKKQEPNCFLFSKTMRTRKTCLISSSIFFLLEYKKH